MRKCNLTALPWEESQSPKGVYHRFQQHISLALGGKKDSGPEAGGFPFDVAMVKVPPGAFSWPCHRHTTQWELFIVQSGDGRLIIDGEHIPIGPGDCFQINPGEAHQIRNAGSSADLIYLVIANNPPADSIYYPNSDKWFIKPQRQLLAATEADYYHGEE